MHHIPGILIITPSNIHFETDQEIQKRCYSSLVRYCLEDFQLNTFLTLSLQLNSFEPLQFQPLSIRQFSKFKSNSGTQKRIAKIRNKNIMDEIRQILLPDVTSWSVQLYVHIGAIIVGLLFYTQTLPLLFNIPEWELWGQVLAHLMIMLLCMPFLSISTRKDSVKFNAKNRYYSISAFFNLLQHTMYFYLFIQRSYNVQTLPENSPPERALIMEVDTLRNLLSLQDNTEEMVIDMRESLKVFDNTPFQDGAVLFWYQIFEGTVHAMIILGTLMHFIKPSQRLFVFFMYEVGTILELVIYGPSYFWVISTMWFNVWFGSLPLRTRGIYILSTFFTINHHTTYVIDTWGCINIVKIWRNPKTELSKSIN